MSVLPVSSRFRKTSFNDSAFCSVNISAYMFSKRFEVQHLLSS